MEWGSALTAQAGPEYTLVSCFFDLARRERNGRREAEFYRQHGPFVLGLRVPMVLYVDPDLAAWVRACREEHGLDLLTEVVPRSFEELPLYSLYPGLASVPAFRNANPVKDTPLYQILNWSKLGLTVEAIAANPFDTDHYAWLDVGVGHMAHRPESPLRLTRRVAILQMCAVAPEEVQDRRAFYDYERGCLAGAFFGGHKDTLAQLQYEFLFELKEALALPARPNEQMVLSYLSAGRGDLFEYYYGDYTSVLSNWDGVRHDLPTVFLNIAHCRTHHLWEDGVRICRTVVDSLQRGILGMTGDEYARLLDEYFIAAWWSGRPELAAELKNEFLARCTDSRYFDEHRPRILDNFGFA